MNLRGPVRRVFLNSLSLALVFACLFFAAIYVSEHSWQINNLGANVSGAEIITLTNENRTAVGLPTLATNPLLTEAAQLKADDMAARSYYAHVSPDGKTPLYWLERVGYPYMNAGENLVIDRTSSEQVVSSWMLSTDHRENILRPQFTEVGVGTAEGEYKGLKTIYVVQEFGTPKPNSALKIVGKQAPVISPKIIAVTATTTDSYQPLVVAPKKEPEIVPGVSFEIKPLSPVSTATTTTISTTRPVENTFQAIISVPKIVVAANQTVSTTTTIATSSDVVVTPLIAISESKPVILTMGNEPATSAPKEVRAASYAPQAFYQTNTAWLQKIFNDFKVGFLSLY